MRGLLSGMAAAASGCSFLVTNANMTQPELEFANHYLRLRGPDHTSHVQRNGVHFVHNLLWLTGKLTPQPFVDERSGVVALFNGEIYNYRDLAQGLATDGEALLPMYRTHGEHFPQRLRGEFAVVVADWERDLLVLSTDVFGTKPFWSASDHNGRFGVASYASALLRLGFKPRLTAELEPNTIEVRQLSSFRLLRRHRLHTFDLCCQHSSMRTRVRPGSGKAGHLWLAAPSRLHAAALWAPGQSSVGRLGPQCLTQCPPGWSLPEAPRPKSPIGAAVDPAGTSTTWRTGRAPSTARWRGARPRCSTAASSASRAASTAAASRCASPRCRWRTTSSA